MGATYAWGDNMQPMLIKIALLLGVPSTQDELENLADAAQVSQTGIETTKDIYLYKRTTQLQIFWGPHKPLQN
ncbi:hypothetical protein HPT25_26945 [Bacillus sp. BRMEA1]|uniref:hypothetical protein n=1 Tax=Neobacillus endophyticus TaxID=2738405 RepID=UPI0015666F81|nr:hypothetical protein [Neobacillus endophyticus]NRD80965.1 hypothetical protein [Neobacillus endophyticus]